MSVRSWAASRAWICGAVFIGRAPSRLRRAPDTEPTFAKGARAKARMLLLVNAGLFRAFGYHPALSAGTQPTYHGSVPSVPPKAPPRPPPPVQRRQPQFAPDFDGSRAMRGDGS